MYRLYLVCAFLALGLFGYAQYRGWSIVPSDAQEFQRQRAEQRMQHLYGGSGSGGSSGHK
jgi:hypothetical protein